MIAAIYARKSTDQVPVFAEARPDQEAHEGEA
jgi:hypothetical protein